MAAEGASHTNYVLDPSELDPSSLIPFVPPDWCPHFHPREPGKYCYKHDICEEVDDDLKRLKGKEEKEAMHPNPSPTMAEELCHSHKKKADEVMMEDLDYQNKKMKILEEDVEGKSVVEKTPEEVEWTQMMKRLDEVLDQFIHKQKIKKGDNHDVLKLLSSPTRDFLIKSGQNHMQQQQRQQQQQRHESLPLWSLDYLDWKCGNYSKSDSVGMGLGSAAVLKFLMLLCPVCCLVLVCSMFGLNH